MAAKSIRPFLPFVAIIILTSIPISSCVEILPRPGCMALGALFTTNRCFTSTPNFACKVLASTLILKFKGQPLCNEYPCTGYAQKTSNKCIKLFVDKCDVKKIDLMGLCEPGRVCCKK